MGHHMNVQLQYWVAGAARLNAKIDWVDDPGLSVGEPITPVLR